MITYHVLIKGKVQGVFYRASAKATAEQLGVKGWIKNTPAGDVAALITGNEEVLDAFVAWCKHGPKMAEVSEVVVVRKEDSTFENFQILR